MCIRDRKDIQCKNGKDNGGERIGEPDKLEFSLTSLTVRVDAPKQNQKYGRILADARRAQHHAMVQCAAECGAQLSWGFLTTGSRLGIIDSVVSGCLLLHPSTSW